jgi:hypothetical protein
MSEDKDDLFKRLSDDELLAAGIEPSNIIWQPDNEPEGPYRLYRTGVMPCPKCGDPQHVFRLGIVNLAVGKAIEDSWDMREQWIANLWCKVMNDGWVSGLSAIQREHFESVRRRTPRSTNTFLQEYLGEPPTEGKDPAQGIVFEERHYGEMVGVGFMLPDGKRHGVVVRREAMIRVAKAVLARWPEPIEDAAPAKPSNET